MHLYIGIYFFRFDFSSMIRRYKGSESRYKNIFEEDDRRLTLAVHILFIYCRAEWEDNI